MFAIGIIEYNVNTYVFQGSTYGYYMTSNTTQGPGTVIDRLAFSGETVSTPSATIPTAINYCTAGRSTLKGYSLDGLEAGNTFSTKIQALTFSGETTATISATMPSARRFGHGVSASLKTYAMGGTTDFSGGGLSSVVALTISGETTSTLSGTISEASGNTDNGISAPLKGYKVGGGVTNTSDTRYATIDALTFATDGVAAISATLPTATYKGSCSSSTTKGYHCGGQTNGADTVHTNAIVALTISGETTSTLSATLSNSVDGVGNASSTTNGYSSGGVTGAGSYKSAIDSLLFSSDTISTISATLSAVRAFHIGTQI